MTHDAYVTGVGAHKFGRWTEKSTIELTATAIKQALDDSCVEFRQVQAAYLGAELSSFVDGRMIVQHFGWTGIPINHYQQACASGSAAFREACYSVASGRIDIALVAGYEKMGGGLLRGGDAARDREFHLHGMGLDVTPARIAMAIQRRMHAYGDTLEMLAAEAAQCYEYGALNEIGPQRPWATAQEIMDSPTICSPLTRKMCCNSSDGAAAAIVMNRRKAAQLGCLDRAVNVAGVAAGSPDADDLVGGPGAHIGGDFRTGDHTRKVAARLYEMAGVGPGDIGVVQCHAPFAGGAMICAEALGFCGEGEGGRFFLEGHARIDGKTPINTDGGLLAGDLRAKLARYHAHVDSAFRGWNGAWLDQNFKAWNIEDFVGRWRVPALLIQGADDPYGTIAQIRAIEARTPEPVASLILEDCRHSPHLEQPQATLGAAVRFCAQIAEEAR